MKRPTDRIGDESGDLVVTLSLPPADVWPNARPHRMALARARRRQRIDAQYAGLAALQAAERSATGGSAWKAAPPPWPSGYYQARWYFDRPARRDPDNRAAALKSSIDGLVDAGIFSDDQHLVPLPSRTETCRSHRPRVELHLWRQDPTTLPEHREEKTDRQGAKNAKGKTEGPTQ